jgi:hypothetical protein
VAMSEETKHKLKKALPFILIGGVVVVFLALKAKGGASQQTGSAPAQDLSMLGGGGSAPVMQQPAVVPADVAQQFAQQFASSRDKRMAMAAQWQDLGNQNGMGQQQTTGVVSKAWQQLSNGNWQDMFHSGHIITEQQAQQLSSQNHGPYAQGGGGFFGQLGSWIGNNLKTAAQVYSASQGVPSGSFGGSAGPQKAAAQPFFQQYGYQGDANAALRGQSPAANGQQQQRAPINWAQVGPKL